MPQWLKKGGRRRSFKLDHRDSMGPFYEIPQPQQVFVPTAVVPPVREPGPGESGGTDQSPIESCIVDFHFDRRHDSGEHHLVVGKYTRDDIILSEKGPSDLMTNVYNDNGIRTKPYLRWIHVPWNSMRDTEVS
jgi:hypothetical protein